MKNFLYNTESGEFCERHRSTHSNSAHFKSLLTRFIYRFIPYDRYEESHTKYSVAIPLLATPSVATSDLVSRFPFALCAVVSPACICNHASSYLGSILLN
uniref:Uncharacterized protein n=1 Tax=Glossina palpalis gambiensis TaxID=67801 RepID=A0A1B0BRX0_9MUSC